MCWKVWFFMGTELLSPHRQVISSPTRYGLRAFMEMSFIMCVNTENYLLHESVTAQLMPNRARKQGAPQLL